MSTTTQQDDQRNQKRQLPFPKWGHSTAPKHLPSTIAPSLDSHKPVPTHRFYSDLFLKPLDSHVAVHVLPFCIDFEFAGKSSEDQRVTRWLIRDRNMFSSLAYLRPVAPLACSVLHPTPLGAHVELSAATTNQQGQQACAQLPLVRGQAYCTAILRQFSGTVTLIGSSPDIRTRVLQLSTSDSASSTLHMMTVRMASSGVVLFCFSRTDVVHDLKQRCRSHDTHTEVELRDFTGVVRIARATDDESFALLEQCAPMVVLGAQAVLSPPQTAHEISATYELRFRTRHVDELIEAIDCGASVDSNSHDHDDDSAAHNSGSGQPALHFALPHHLESLADDADAQRTDYKLETASKGVATGLIGSRWKLEIPLASAEPVETSEFELDVTSLSEEQARQLYVELAREWTTYALALHRNNTRFDEVDDTADAIIAAGDKIGAARLLGAICRATDDCDSNRQLGRSLTRLAQCAYLAHQLCSRFPVAEIAHTAAEQEFLRNQLAEHRDSWDAEAPAPVDWYPEFEKQHVPEHPAGCLPRRRVAHQPSEASDAMQRCISRDGRAPTVASDEFPCVTLHEVLSWTPEQLLEFFMCLLHAGMKMLVCNFQPNRLVYDVTWGGIIPAAGMQGDVLSDDSASLYHDHHTLWAHFIYAAAILSHLLPDWPRVEANRSWVNCLIADVLTTDERDDTFPPFRCFDWYCGHDYAGGLTASHSGKQRLSLSEDLHLYHACILWARVAQDDRLLLTATVMKTILLQSSGTCNSVTGASVSVHAMCGVLFDGGAHYCSSSGSSDDEEVHGMHILPITASLPLLRSRSFVAREWKQRGFNRLLKRLIEEKSPWASVFICNLALVDAAKALALLDKCVVMHEDLSRAWIMHWCFRQLQSQQEQQRQKEAA